MAGNENIDRTVQILLADYDRQDGCLSKNQVERVLEKRRLAVDECAEVLRQLETLGVTVEDETTETEDVFSESFPGEPQYDSDRSPAWDRFASRIHNAKVKILTAEEEIELGRRMELGRRAKEGLKKGEIHSLLHDSLIENAEKARERMVLCNLGLVLHIAKPYLGISDMSMDDLFQEGTMGLMRAVEKFDYTFGYKFSTYATWWIRQSITRALADRGATIRLPVYVYADVYRLKKAQRLLIQIRPERRPSISELADELTWTDDKVHFIQQVAAMVPASLDESLHGFDDRTLMETLVSEYESPQEYVERIALGSDIAAVLQGLAERERDVLTLRFGLQENGERMTLEEIGQKFGLTRERIRQIEAKVLARIRRSIKANPEHRLSAYVEE